MTEDKSFTLGIEAADKVASALTGNAAHYETLLVHGPAENQFTGKPHESQLAFCVSVIRSGDMMLQALKDITLDTNLDRAVNRLQTSMLALAGRAVMHDRPMQVFSEGTGQSVVKGMTGFPDPASKPLCEAIIKDMLGQNSRLERVWQPINDVVKALCEYGDDRQTAEFIYKLQSMGDDNDLACVVGRFTNEAVAKYVNENDPRAGDLAYELSRQDSAIMGSELPMDKAEFLEFSTNDHHQRIKNKMSMG